MTDIKNKRVTIVSGHYGSGKTTFSINYGLLLRENTDKLIYIADLDIVNPYFRSRDHIDFLSKNNIKVIGSYLNQSGADLPAVSADVFTVFENKSILGIVDLGGNAVGTLVFANFRENVDEKETDLFFILNANRKETSSVEDARGHLLSIETSLNMKVTAIVNNTHLMGDTSLEDIEKGEYISQKLSEEASIAVKYTCVSRDFVNENPNLDLKYDKLILDFDIKSGSNVR